MADRVSASITIGGVCSPDLYAMLAGIIADEGLSTEWDGPAFLPEQRVPGEPLRLCAHEVRWGRFEELENFCIRRHVLFARWSGAYSGSFGAERLVFTGTGEPQYFVADEEDFILIGRETAERLGSFAAILAHFDAADFPIPPLVLAPDEREADNG
jgi:hypothetical protein